MAPRRDDPAELTEPQLTSAHLAELAHDPRLRHTTAVSRYAAPLDRDAFAAAVAHVTAQHGDLQSYAGLNPGQPPTWTREAASTPAVSFIDLRRRAPDARDRAHSSAVHALIEEPFDLCRPPLIRFLAVQLTDTDTRIYTVAHPALLDRLAAAAVHIRIMERCGAGPLPALAHEPSAAGRHEAGAQDAPGPEADLDAWVDGFAGFTPSTPQFWATCPVELASAGSDATPVPARADPAAPRLVQVTVPRESTRAIMRLAKACAATPADVLLAVHAKALSAATGHTDLAIGVETYGGPRPDHGSRTTTIAVRVILGSGTWTDLLAHTSAAHNSARRFRDLSHLRICRALGISRMFDTSFAYREADNPGFGAGPTLWADTQLYAPFAGAAFVEFVRHSAIGQLTLRITAGSELTGNQISELVRLHLSALAHCDGAARHDAMPLLDPEQREVVLRRWNGPRTAYPTQYCVHELFEQQSRRTPAALAVADAHEHLSYRELNERANRLAHRLRAAGAGAGSVVGIYARRDAALIVAFLAVLKTGAAYLPLEPRQPADRTGFLLQDAGAGIVLTDATYHAAVPDGPWAVMRTDEVDPNAPATDLGCTCTPEDLMYVIYTSGSTGLPKGVQVPHAGIVNYLGWCMQSYAARGEGGAALFSSVAFDMVVPNIFTPLLMGQRVCVLDESLDMPAVAERLAALAPFSFLKLTPGQLGVLAELLDPDQARRLAATLAVGADAFPVRTLRSWRRVDDSTPMVNEYGPTEASVGNCVYDVHGAEQGELLPIGRPIPNTTMYVLNDAQTPVPVGAPGELYIGGSCVVRGYANRTDLTTQRFLPDPFSDVADARMYRTGDIGRWLPDGMLDFLGRIDDQVKIRGYRVEPAEVEAALVQHPSISEAVVTVTGQTRETLALVGYYVAATDLAPDTVRDFISRRVPDYLVPQLLTPIAAVPLTANGKIDRTALPAPMTGKAARRRQQAAAAGPHGQTLRHAWHDAMGHEPGDTDEHIAGPHTPLAAPTLLALHLARAASVPSAQAFALVAATTTFGELAERLEQARRAADPEDRHDR